MMLLDIIQTAEAAVDPKILPYLGLQIWDSEDILKLLIRFTLNFIIIGTIVRFIYFPLTHRKDYLFTFFLISIIVFLLCFLLDNVKLQLGFALGLFAIFGILRYRTDTIPIKEMTYLFLVIGISVINALANKKISISELAFANFIVLGVTYGLEMIWSVNYEVTKSIKYEKIDLIKSQNHDAMLADLEERTGLSISRMEIGNIDFLNDTAQVIIYYHLKKQKNNNHGDTGKSS